MDIWLRRRLHYINEHMNNMLQPDKIERFYNTGVSLSYRHSNDYYIHVMFFVLVFIRNHDESLNGF